jgi:3-keto-disaccharide hydrolase
MRRSAFALFAVGAVSLSTRGADDGWTDLLKSGPDSPWKEVAKGWIFAPDTSLDPANPKRLKVRDGAVWVNGETGRGVKDLITKADYGDCEVHVEFLIGKGSNSGIKFHALYEIQIYDSYGKKLDQLTGNDCGGIYPRAETTPRYTYLDKGVPPKVNACRPAGEWQTLDAVFRAARFDDKGEKKQNAKVLTASLNGQVIHEDQEMKTPTGSNYVKKEMKEGPFMLQADHGPVAFRNVKIRAVKEEKKN